MRYAQLNDQQKGQIQGLNDQLLKFDEKHQKAVEQVVKDKNEEIDKVR